MYGGVLNDELLNFVEKMVVVFIVVSVLVLNKKRVYNVCSIILLEKIKIVEIFRNVCDFD